MVVSDCLAGDLWGLPGLVGGHQWAVLVYVALVSTHFLLRGRRTTARYIPTGVARLYLSSIRHVLRCSAGKLGEPLSSTTWGLVVLRGGVSAATCWLTVKVRVGLPCSTRIRPSVPPTARTMLWGRCKLAVTPRVTWDRYRLGHPAVGDVH